MSLRPPRPPVDPAPAVPLLVPPPLLPHKYVGGHPAVNFVNTIDWTTRGPVDERLDDYGRLTRWAEGAGVLSAASATALRSRAAAHPRRAARVLATARDLRRVLQQAFTAAAHGEPLGATLDAFTPFLATVATHRRLVPGIPTGDVPVAGDPTAAPPARWHWQGGDVDLDAPWWPVAWHAAELLASAEAGRLRVCGAPECGWMYLDHSRNGMRRWCQMGVCGTRAKSRRRAERVAAGR